MATAANKPSLHRLAILILVGVVLCLAVFFGLTFLPIYSPLAEALRMQVGGTSTAFFIMDHWGGAYFNAKGVRVDFESTGSTKGVSEMIDGKYLVGFSHAPVTDAQRAAARAKGGEIVQIPVVLCGVVPVYNVKELANRAPLKFTGAVLADIFLGKITKWNDPALAKLNGDAPLPETSITVVHREDSSGSTQLFAEYLYESSPAWRTAIGPARSEIKWPVGVGMARSAGVAERVVETEGAIGYVDLLHAMSGDIAHGAVENADKTAFIHASPENILAAAKSGKAKSESPSELAIELTNNAGPNAYPISGAIWAVCYRKRAAAEQKQIADFLAWIVHDGQKFAKDRTYAPLPPDLVAIVDATLKLLEPS